MTTITPAGATTSAASCDPATRITRSLLGYGVLAGPCYVAVSLAQALTREGFDVTRHAWSLLSNGHLGWIQITNFVLTGLMTIAFAVGLRRAFRSGPGGTWAPRLIAAYGVSLIGAGVFRADPVPGFPPGAPVGGTQVSLSGMLHLASGGIGFLCMVTACLVIGRRFAARSRPLWAAFSRTTGIVFLAAFIGIATGGGSVATTLAFVAAVVLAWTWMAALAVHAYRAAAGN